MQALPVAFCRVTSVPSPVFIPAISRRMPLWVLVLLLDSRITVRWPVPAWRAIILDGGFYSAMVSAAAFLVMPSARGTAAKLG